MKQLLAPPRKHWNSNAAALRLQRRCACSGECENCNAKRLMREPESGGAARTSTIPPSVRQTVASGGRPLDHATRSVMEPRFGRGFSSVRVHTSDSAAQWAARAVNALAYTVGDNIAAGMYAREATAGRQLLAHVVQRTPAYWSMQLRWVSRATCWNSISFSGDGQFVQPMLEPIRKESDERFSTGSAGHILRSTAGIEMQPIVVGFFGQRRGEAEATEVSAKQL